MSDALDDEIRDWLRRPWFWVMGTLNPDGGPQLTPMWAGLETIDGTEWIVVDTSRGRMKEQNLRRDPRLSLCSFSPDNPYDRVEIRGRAAGFVEGAPASRIMDRLAQKYLGTETFPWPIDGEVRVAVLIKPDYVHRTIGVEPFRPGVLPT
ncbi:PPOX class F420-dependent oxidoreductase [Nocardia arthritidis]|uniref:TIGR03618 family F420-dependent PPOX class oxidoreductase n=1 Tax=Nocardia arthritidis TaxID=228602 RepID=A0A6G9YA93_9NOCA|nr:PPOX class F420-dependent oxidoreductase [Nocardia arthritidis]QIS10149.1 TIGR03618 family F420-dependent PPOX class oxidoreductase [Nocardia arthritidis]